MIFYLMRRNKPELRAIVFSVVAAAAFYMLPQAAKFAGIPLFVVAWAAMPQRGTIFDATLPIRGRDIFASQVLWALPLLWLPIVAWIFAPNIGNVRDVPVIYMLDALAMIALATVLPYAVRPAEINDLPFLLIAALWAALLFASAAIVYLLPPAVALYLLAVAVVVAARVTWMRVPDTLEIAPRRAAAAKLGRLGARESKSPAISAGHAWKPLLWSLLPNSRNVRIGQPLLSLIIYIVLFLAGTGGADRFQPYVIVYLTMPIVMARYNTRWLSAFPISNRQRLWCVLVPGTVLGLLCLQLGMIASPYVVHDHRSLATHAPAVDGERDNVTRVPLEYWHRTSRGFRPTITSPQGEEVTADTFSVPGLTLYNPYTTRVGSSTLFTEWQFERATTAVYGRALSIDYYKRAEANGALPQRVLDTTAMRILNIAAIVFLALLVALASELTLWRRVNGKGGSWSAGSMILLIPCIIYIGVNLTYGRYPASEVVVPLTEHALWRLSHLLPTNAIALALAASLPTIATYAILERVFGRTEYVEPRLPNSHFSRALVRPLARFYTS